MKLDGRELAGYIQMRHAGQVRSFGHRPPRLAIVRQGATPATDMFLRVKERYGTDIGVPVDTYTETPETILGRIQALNEDDTVTGINVELPFADDPSLEQAALDAVALSKDVDGLATGTGFEVATPKGILWLLAAYTIELKGKVIAVVGQGRLVGEPLSRMLEASGHEVRRIDDTVEDLAAQLRDAQVVITATGVAGLITSEMIAPGAVIIDAGAPASDLADDVRGRDDITISPNPGGVGPMTIAALFDNLLLAAKR